MLFSAQKKNTYKSKRKTLYFLIYCTVLNLDKLKLKEPEKNYELTNFDLNVSIDGVLTNFSFKF